MPKYQTTRIVNYAQNEIFDVMMNIAKYPDILLFIKKIDIKKQTETMISATVFVGIGPLAFSYDCEIIGKPYDMIEITASKGIFNHLYAKWSFKAVSENSTEVTCLLDAEFSSKAMELAGGKMFASQFQQAIKTFERYLRNSRRTKGI